MPFPPFFSRKNKIKSCSRFNFREMHCRRRPLLFRSEATEKRRHAIFDFCRIMLPSYFFLHIRRRLRAKRLKFMHSKIKANNDLRRKNWQWQGRGRIFEFRNYAKKNDCVGLRRIFQKKRKTRYFRGDWGGEGEFPHMCTPTTSCSLVLLYASLNLGSKRRRRRRKQRKTFPFSSFFVRNLGQKRTFSFFQRTRTNQFGGERGKKGLLTPK